MPSFLIAALIEPQFVSNSQTTLFTSPLSTFTRIDSLSVVNTGTVVETVSINLVPNGGTVGAANLTTKAQAVQPGLTWNSPNEIGKVLLPGDVISVIASTGSVLAISAGGLLQA